MVRVHLEALMEKGRVVLIELDVAKPFIEKWHYSEKVPTGKNIYFGWYVDDKLYAVANYGIGVNPFQASFLSKVTGLDVEATDLLELKRLCRCEPKLEKMPLTHFLSKSHKQLKKLGYKYVVSFSDPAYNHSGGIYKAANFQCLGKTNPEWHLIDEDGIVRHRRYAYRYSRRKGIPIGEARKQLGVKRHKTVQKDRWFIKI